MQRFQNEIEIPELSATPSGNPPSGFRKIYTKAAGLFMKTSGGVETQLASGTTVATDAIFDAKGDLAVGTGADTSAKLTVGADGTVLSADSSQSTGVIWVEDWRTIAKTADESVTSSTTIQDDDHFVTPTLLANTTYIFKFFLALGTIGGNFKCGLTLPSGATFQMNCSSYGSASVGSGATSTSGTAQITTNTQANGFIEVNALVNISSTAGTVRLQWAQASASGTASQLKKGSTMSYRKAA